MNIMQSRSNAKKIARDFKKNRLMALMDSNADATPALSQIVRPENTPILIIVPSSVAENWNNECECPRLCVSLLHTAPTPLLH